MKRLKGELQTIVFLIGYGLVIAGVAQVSVSAAYVSAGLVLCVGAVLMAVREERDRERKRRRRERNDLE